MYSYETGIFSVEITTVLYRYNAKKVYHEKSRHSDGFIYYVKGGHAINFDTFSIETNAGDLLYLPYAETYSNKLKEKGTEYYQIDFQLYEKRKACASF